jgi:hypothetical protein
MTMHPRKGTTRGLLAAVTWAWLFVVLVVVVVVVEQARMFFVFIFWWSRLVTWSIRLSVLEYDIEIPKTMVVPVHKRSGR